MSISSEFDLISAGASHRGAVRRINEDYWCDRADIGLWVVADGMGGHQAGDVASRTVVEFLASIPPPADAEHLLLSVHDTIMQANQALLQEAERREPGTVIGATVLALMIREGHFACLWAGDSRLYRLRDDRLEQLSHDHSQIQELLDAEVVTAQEAEHHPLSHVLTRAIGVRDELLLEKVTGALAEDDIFLMCTDGLSKMVSDEEISDILRRFGTNDVPGALIDAALAHGGGDNVTVLAVRVCRK